jgi:hypothetical protein
MRPEEIQKLLGGYATDTLTPAERRTLFEAALANQQVFDELAREQALRDLLQDPSARQQLLNTLEALRGRPRKRRLGGPVTVWATAGFAAALVVVGVMLEWRTPPAPPVQIAVVRPPASIVAESTVQSTSSPAARTLSKQRAKPPSAVRWKRAGQAASARKQEKASTVPPASITAPPMAGYAPMAGFAGSVGQNSVTTDLAVRGPLSLRYTVLVSGVPAPPDRPISADQPVVLSLLPNQDGYLYVLQRGAAGQWQLRFGSKVEAGKSKLIPTGTSPGDTQPGRKIWLAVLSRGPDPAVQSLVPERVDELVRQAHLVTEGSPLRRMVVQTGLVRESVRVSSDESSPVAVEIPLEFR